MDSKRLLSFARDIQQIPAPTFSEYKRAEFIEKEFQRAGLCDVSIDELGNVYGRTPGEPEPSIVVSAHMDSVFPHNTDLELQSKGSLLIGPGIGDNAIAQACMLEIANTLTTHSGLNGNVWFVGNVREEGLGDLQGMRRVVERFGDSVIAYIVLEGMGLGHIYHRALQVLRYRISIETKGGHAWIHAGRESAIHTLLEIGSEIVRLSRPENVQSSLNIGMIQGGTSINTIASSASMDLDLRSEVPELLNHLEQQLQKTCNQKRSTNVKVRLEKIGQRPGGAIPKNHTLVRLACEAIKAGEIAECRLGIASTDANIPLSMGFPAVCIGLTQGGNAHTTMEYIDTETIQNGFNMLYHLILSLLNTDALGN